jgi:hypothetical protein
MSRSSSAFACFLLALAASSFSTRADALVLPWYYGPITPEIGEDIACGSDIVETLVAAYSGYTYWPPTQDETIPFAQLPAVGEVFYVKLVVSHPGNPCADSAVGLELLLPSGVTTAVSADNPVFCFSRLPSSKEHTDPLLDNLAADVDYGCPQTFEQGIEGLAILAPQGGFGGGSWGMAAEYWLEFLIPLKSAVTQNGSNQVYFRINPDIGVIGYTNIVLYVNSDTIFRTPMEDTGLTLDICTLSPIAQGC